MEPSRKPFAETLSALLEEDDVSIRELARRGQKHSGTSWPSAVSISLLCRGEMEPTIEMMDVIARALQIKPETFAEYRLERARERLNWRTVGLAAALRELGE